MRASQGGSRDAAGALYEVLVTEKLPPLHVLRDERVGRIRADLSVVECYGESARLIVQVDDYGVESIVWEEDFESDVFNDAGWDVIRFDAEHTNQYLDRCVISILHALAARSSRLRSTVVLPSLDGWIPETEDLMDCWPSDSPRPASGRLRCYEDADCPRKRMRDAIRLSPDHSGEPLSRWVTRLLVPRGSGNRELDALSLYEEFLQHRPAASIRDSVEEALRNERK